MKADEFDRFFRLATVKAADMIGADQRELLDEINTLLETHYPGRAA
jgi:hypothetical protein